MLLKKYLIKYWYLFLILFFVVFINCGSELFLPFAAAQIVDIGIEGQGLVHNSPNELSRENYAKIINESSEYDKNLVEKSYNKETNDGTDVYIINAYGEAHRKQLDIAVGYFGEYADIIKSYDQYAELIAKLQNQNASDQEKDSFKDLLQEYVNGISKKFDIVELFDSVNAEKVRPDNINNMQIKFMYTESLIMLILVLIQIFTFILANYLIAKISMNTARDFRKKMYEVITNKNFRTTSNHSNATLLTRIANDVQIVQNSLLYILMNIFYSPIMITLGFLMISLEIPFLIWILIISAVIVIAVMVILSLYVRPKFIKIQNLIDKFNTRIQETVFGIHTIKFKNNFSNEKLRFKHINLVLKENTLLANIIIVFGQPAAVFVLNLINVVGLLVGCFFILSNQAEIGALIAFMSYSELILWSVIILVDSLSMLPRLTVSLKRIYEVIDIDMQLNQKKNLLLEDKISTNCDIRLNGVSYLVQDWKIIDNINIKFKENKKTVIYGSTGSGKSTLLKVIMGIYKADEGCISIGDINICNNKIDGYHDGLFSYAPQKAVIFNGTIRENITLFDSKIQQDIIDKAILLSCSDSIINKKARGLESKMAQDGGDFSGGEKQRICFCRAITHNKPVMILDDCFSGLDVSTKHRVLQNLNQIKNTTILYTTKNVEDLKFFDEIVILQEGQIVAHGSHRDLLSSSNFYKQMYTLNQ